MNIINDINNDKWKLLIIININDINDINDDNDNDININNE